MNKIQFKLLLLLVMALGMNSTNVLAQQPLKGRWLFTVQIEEDGKPLLRAETPFIFKADHKGYIKGPEFVDGQGQIKKFNTPFSYMEKDSNFDISYEFAIRRSPQIGSDLINGTM